MHWLKVSRPTSREKVSVLEPTFGSTGCMSTIPSTWPLFDTCPGARTVYTDGQARSGDRFPIGCGERTPPKSAKT